MAVFDQFAKNYEDGHAKAVKLSGFTPGYLHEYKVQILAESLKKAGLSGKPLKLLNFGCGTGGTDPYLRKALPEVKIFSTDISGESVAVAKERNSSLGNIEYAQFDGERIPFQESFDVVFLEMVMHHIPRTLHSQSLKMLWASLAKDGRLFIFEQNPFNPLTQLVYYKNDYKFDKNAKLVNPYYAKKLLAGIGAEDVKLKYSVFFPALLSALIPYEKHMTWLPAGAHYYIEAGKSL